MTRTTRLSSAIGTIAVMTLLAGCAGGDEPEPAAETPTEGPMAAAPAAPPAGAPAGAAAPANLPPGVDAALVAAGQQVFTGQGLCFTCHGQNAQGTPLAPNLTDDQWLNIENPEQDLQSKIGDLVRTGVPQPVEHPAPMPPMGGAQLSDEQINAVVAYVVSLQA